MRRLILFAILLLPPTTMAAQAVRGKLTVAGGAPIAGAIVTLVDTGGTVVARVLSTPLGGYSLATRTTGTFTLRVLRVGFPAWSSRPFTLLVGGVGEVNAELPEDAIVLAEIDVGGRGACQVGADDGSTTATLLEEVAKALGSAELALKDREYAFQMVRRTEQLQNSGFKVKSDSVVQLLYTWPFWSLPAVKLRDGGFVQRQSVAQIENLPLDGSDGYIWFGPEASTLLAPPFLETHCFKVVTDRKDSTRVGLSFKPARGRKLSDISGTLWVDRRTLVVHTLDYEYVNVPADVPSDGARGGMEFLRLPNGLWIVSRWTIRAPMEGARSVSLSMWAEQTSYIREIRRIDGELVYLADLRPR